MRGEFSSVVLHSEYNSVNRTKYEVRVLDENFLSWQKIQDTARDYNMQMIDISFLFRFPTQSINHLDRDME